MSDMFYEDDLATHKALVKMMRQYKACSICQRKFSTETCFNAWTLENGNNAAPINDGRCCDVCNETVVLPARIERIRTKET